MSAALKPRASVGLIGQVGVVLTAGLVACAAGVLVSSSAAPFLLIGLAAAIVLAIAISSVRASWAMYFVAISLSGMSVAAGPTSIRPETLAIPLLFLACARSWPGTAKSWRDANVATYFVAAIFSVLAISSSALAAPQPAPSLWIALQLMLGIAAYLIVNPVEEAKRSMVLIGTAVVGGIAAISLLSYVGRMFVGLPVEVTPGVALDNRLIGFSLETNLFASQSVGWLAVMFCWRKSLPTWSKWMAAVITLAVLASGTRAAWIALVVILAAIVWTNWRRSRYFIPVTSIAGVLFAVVITSSFANYDPNDKTSLQWRLLHLLDTDSGTGAYRANIYETAISDIDTPVRWLFGTGMNSYSQFHLLDATGVTSAYLSSIWYELLYDVGLIGLAVFVTLMIVIWRRGHPAGLVLLVTLLLCATSTNLFWLTFPWISLALIPGRKTALRENSSPDELRSPASSPGARHPQSPNQVDTRSSGLPRLTNAAIEETTHA